MTAFPFLFNFSASPRGGGLKRLQEYARWFDRKGGATFVIHPECSTLRDEFPANRYLAPRRPPLQRLVNDGGYLRALVAENGPFEFYYAYGIPVYERLARCNWFHLSNVMPFNFWRHRLPLADYAKQPLLAHRYRHNLSNADVISAESSASLEFLGARDRSKLFVSVNGSDDELSRAGHAPPVAAEPVAVVVGTYSYKAIDDSYRVYRHMRSRQPDLRLVIFGVPETVPAEIRADPAVTCAGLRPRAEVVAMLDRAQFYISTTRLENSWNAASEGIFLARESFISAIPPHRELLAGQDCEHADIPGVETPMMHVFREKISPRALKTWDQVVVDMLRRADLIRD